MRSIINKFNDIPKAYIHMGEGGLFKEPTAVSTVLGSCVTVTIFCRKLGMGSAFHAFLPYQTKKKADGYRGEYVFVDSAVRKTSAAFIQEGMLPKDLEAKVFGGANSLSMNSVGVGRQNVRAALEALETERIRVLVTHVGGARGRSLLFLSHTGEVYVKLHKNLLEEDPAVPKNLIANGLSTS